MSKEEDRNPGEYVTYRLCDEKHKSLEKLLDERFKSNRNWLIGVMAATAFWLSVLQLYLSGVLKI